MLKASRSVASEAASQLQSAILDGRWQTGTMLPGQRELAQSMGISRASLREAISMLEALGLVSAQAGRGVVVTHGQQRESSELPTGPAETQPADTFVFRLALEPLAAFLAAQRITPARASQLWTLQSDLEQALAQIDLVAASEADLAFHLRIAEYSDNPMIAQSLSTASAGLAHNLRLPFADIARIRETADEHRRITSTISAGDAEQARLAMHQHLAGAAARAGVDTTLLSSTQFSP